LLPTNIRNISTNVKKSIFRPNTHAMKKKSLLNASNYFIKEENLVG
jgi:tRNA A22 N-methylase